MGQGVGLEVYSFKQAKPQGHGSAFDVFKHCQQALPTCGVYYYTILAKIIFK